MKLNEAVIPHYRSEIIPIEILKKKVSLNEKYLKEKHTWYNIDGKLQYFKIRNDFRLFTEQFYSSFAKKVFDLDTLDYHIAYVRTVDPVIAKGDEITKCGLLSENFQENTYNYYLVSELLNSEISNFIAYGGYTLQKLLAFFKDYLSYDSYKENELFLIKLFISDAFTHQEDRNYHNISFKTPKIDGIPYSKRLHTEIIQDHKNSEDYIEIENGVVKLKNFTPAKVYDNERILGTDHKNVFTYQPNQVWCPIFPYSENTLFNTQEEAIKSQKLYDGLDPNLCELYIQHTDLCQPIFERLAYDDEYRKTLEQFKSSNSQISLSAEETERIIGLFQDKQKVIKKILKY